MINKCGQKPEKIFIDICCLFIFGDVSLTFRYLLSLFVTVHIIRTLSILPARIS